MKAKLFTIILCGISFILQAQTVDEILAKHFENTGGKDKWEALQGMKITAKVNMQGMELPISMIQMRWPTVINILITGSRFQTRGI